MLVMMLMLDSGTRLGETLSAELEQLNIEKRSLYLPADKTKGRKERTVYFSEKTARELRHWLQFRDRLRVALSVPGAAHRAEGAVEHLRNQLYQVHSTGRNSEAHLTAYASEQFSQALPDVRDGHIHSEQDIGAFQRTGNGEGIHGCDG